MSSGPIIEARGVVKTFDDGRLVALDHVDLTVDEGEFLALAGPSGCGKSTLLNLISALDRPDEGSIIVAGHDLSHTRDYDHFRARDIGLIFQLDNLLPTLTASENIQVPMFGQGRRARQRRDRATELLGLVGLAARHSVRPPQLSGGERQRVAIARALANEPRIILADEPTGRLDSLSSRKVMDLLDSLRRQRGATLVIVSHDPVIAGRADRVVHMLDGRVLSDEEWQRALSAAAAPA